MPASHGPVVVSSSALRWRGLRSSTVPTLPLARDRGRAEVDLAGAVELVHVVERELVGRSITSIRWRPASSLASTWPRSSPCAIS